jgi:hypothetical protein
MPVIWWQGGVEGYFSKVLRDIQMKEDAAIMAGQKNINDISSKAKIEIIEDEPKQLPSHNSGKEQQ